MSEDKVDEKIIEDSGVPSPALATPTNRESSVGVVRKMKGEVQLFVLLVIFLCILSLFGGKLLGTWYSVMEEETSTNGVDRGNLNFGIGNLHIDGEVNGLLNNDTLEIDYDDWNCFCSETEDVMNNVKLLVYLNTFIAFVIIYFLRFKKFNKERTEALLFLILVISLITALYFATSLPEAIDKDGGTLGVYQSQEEDPSFISLNSEISYDGGDSVLKAQWFPNFGFFTLIFNVILSVLALISLSFDFKKVLGSLD